jgi:hypothetical protein
LRRRLGGNVVKKYPCHLREPKPYSVAIHLLLSCFSSRLFVQNYLASFGLCPSSGMWKFYKITQRFGDWFCLRPQVDPVIEISSFWRAQLSVSTLPHPPEDGDRSSLRNVVVFVKTSTYQTMDRVQKKPNSSVQHTPSSESFQVYPAYLFMIYWTMLAASQVMWRRRIVWLANNVEGNSRSLIWGTARSFPGRVEKTNKFLSQDSGLRTKIWSWNVRNLANMNDATAQWFSVHTYFEVPTNPDVTNLGYNGTKSSCIQLWIFRHVEAVEGFVVRKLLKKRLAGIAQSA